jgi:serine/threonine protein phosphatase 1
VATLTHIKRCLQLPANPHGRDLVVGDLHGHRTLFEAELDRLGFDPRTDRVLSVGDLIDRGPESLATLALIEQPWFHAVLGNHELMLLNYLGFYDSRVHARKAFAQGGGAWIADALARHRKRVARLAERIAALPLALHVAGDVPFNVMHGDLHPLGAGQKALLGMKSVGIHEADAATSSRANIAQALGSELVALTCSEHEVHVSATPLTLMPITYVGHSPMRQITVHKSYVYIDQGVCLRSTKRTQRPPTVLEHRHFAHWLHGVSTARQPVDLRARPSGELPFERVATLG